MRTQVLAVGPRRARHHQQLRHRPHALGHLPAPAKKTGRATSRRGAADDAARTAPTSQERGFAQPLWPRTGRGQPPRLGDRRAPDDNTQRWDISQLGASADGSDDYRNEPNTFGYVVEIDPYDRNAADQEAHGAWAASRTRAPPSEAGGRQAAGRLHGRRLARRVHLQVRLAPPPGSRPMPTPPTASPPATSTWTTASSTSPSSTPTAPAAGSS